MTSRLKINIISQDGIKLKTINIKNCDNPKTCESSKHIGAGNYICDHYNFSVLYPAKEESYSDL